MSIIGGEKHRQPAERKLRRRESNAGMHLHAALSVMASWRININVINGGS
jgi:hypothetical protein